MSPEENLQLYRRGFGDGARSSAHRHPKHEHYMQGWRDGAKAISEALRARREAEGVPFDPMSIFRGAAAMGGER